MRLLADLLARARLPPDIAARMRGEVRRAGGDMFDRWSDTV